MFMVAAENVQKAAKGVRNGVEAESMRRRIEVMWDAEEKSSSARVDHQCKGGFLGKEWRIDGA